MNKLFKSAIAALAAGMVLTSITAAPVSAQSLTPSGPNEAAAPANGWVTLAAGESHWYAFDYDYDSGNVPAQALVELEVAVEDSVGFEVWTPKEVRIWANGEKVSPVGVGSEVIDDSFTLAWAGSAAASDTYYVIVENNLTVASNYKLDISGATVSFSAPVYSGSVADVIETVAATPVQSESLGLSVESAPVAAAGLSPVSASAPNSEWTMLAAGATRYYSFKYDYDNSGDALPAQAIVELEMAKEKSVEFEIWTSDQARLWANGESFDAIGMGSLKSVLTGNQHHDTKLIWAGSAAASDTYYIVVKNTTNGAAYYSLNVSGEDVTY